jgi:hypothetical protein
MPRYLNAPARLPFLPPPADRDPRSRCRDAVPVSAEDADSSIADAKRNGLSREELEGISRSAPDFLIELVSRWKTQGVLLRTMPLWLGNGVSLAWVIGPGTRSAILLPPAGVPVTVKADWLVNGR